MQTGCCVAWAGKGGEGAGRGSPEVGAERYHGEKGSLIPSVSPVIFTLVLLTTCLAWNARPQYYCWRHRTRVVPGK